MGSVQKTGHRIQFSYISTPQSMIPYLGRKISKMLTEETAIFVGRSV
jgi:hypothetical protein